jgi:SAM-dependent methyltransferase
MDRLPEHRSLGLVVSHPEQLGFFGLVEEANRRLIEGARVVEIGSYDVNGSVRDIFGTSREYIGVDLREGPGVDMVAFGHELDLPDASFDVAISGECLEHDPYWVKTILNMCRMTRSGGLVAFTCGSSGRPEHGTLRTDRHESPGTQAQGLDYYQNLSEDDVSQGLELASLFDDWAFWYLPTTFDLYFAGVRCLDSKYECETARLPSEHDVHALRGLLPMSHRIARLPLRVVHRLVRGEHYQDVILPYWRMLLAMQDVALAGKFRRPGVGIGDAPMRKDG